MVLCEDIHPLCQDIHLLREDIHPLRHDIHSPGGDIVLLDQLPNLFIVGLLKRGNIFEPLVDRHGVFPS
jgi:hypothetical protein